MQSVNEFKIADISFDIAENKNSIIIRFLNSGPKKVHTALSDSRYISISAGVLHMLKVLPVKLEYSTMGEDIPENSFLNVEISFGIKKIQDGDRLELRAQNIADVTFIREEGKWYVYHYNSKRELEDRLNSSIEHFETIEEKFGITLQNFSISIVDENEIKMYCEVMSLSENAPYSSFSVEVATYDKSNKIVSHNSIHKAKSDFMGFEVFAFTNILPISVSEIGKIVFYPTK